MLIDSFLLKSIVQEFQVLKESNLRQIYQFGKSTIYLYFQNHVVRICLDPIFAHICIAEKEDFSDHHPSNFVMLMRARLRNAKLKKVEQVGFDRIIFFEFDKIDETGDRHLYRLYIEFFGTHCNMILVENNTVVDAFKYSSTSLRTVEKGHHYDFPAQKLNPFEISYDFFNLTDEKQTISQFISKTISGFSKLMIEELLTRAKLDDKLICDLDSSEKNSLKHAFFSIINDYQKGRIYVYDKKDRFVLSAVPLKHLLHNVEVFESPSKAVEHAYTILHRRQVLKQTQTELAKVVKEYMKKEIKILDAIEDELKECEKSDTFLQYGELLKYASDQNQNGDLVNVFDYSTGKTLSIPLVMGKDIRQSSQHYFDLYKKLKEKGRVLRTRIEKSKQFLTYLEQLLHTIESADDLEILQEIKQEMAQQGMIKKEKQQIQRESDFRKIEYQGFLIMIGKNNKQNEKLLKQANDKDLWLHVHEIPGAHVVIRTADRAVSEDVLKYAAALAAYHSKARFSSKVPVDYTLVKNVHKPKGSPPGFVVYTNYETIFVDPQIVESHPEYH